MDLCIKTDIGREEVDLGLSFNPCFNGSMYKNSRGKLVRGFNFKVSILVLMDLCIKTLCNLFNSSEVESFNPCFNGSMYKNSSSFNN